MPIALDPGERFKVVLKSDQAKPAETRPTFEYRYLTGRQWRQVGAAQDRLDEGTGAAEIVDTIYEAARVGLVGWRNMIDPETGQEIPFDPAALEDLIGISEAQEIILAVLSQTPNAAEKKS